MALAPGPYQATPPAHGPDPDVLEAGRRPHGRVPLDGIGAVVLLDGRPQEEPDAGPGPAPAHQPGDRQDGPGVEAPRGTPQRRRGHAELEAGDDPAGSDDPGELGDGGG